MPLPEHAVVSAEEIETAYDVSSDVDYPFADFASDQEQRLYRDGLHVAGDFSSDDGEDGRPYNVIVDGDLIVEGDLDWRDYGSGCFILVTGDLRCKNLLLQGRPAVVIRGDLTVENGIHGHHGDNGGTLKVRGETKAKVVVNTLYFNMDFGSPPDALVCSDEHRISCPVDFTDEELHDLFLPDLLDASGIDEDAVSRALREGREVLRPGVRPSHLVALDAIETLIAKGEPVDELDLSKKKLRGFPARALELRGLKRLLLRGNALGEVPADIAKLTELEELDVAECDLQSLPEALSQLTKLSRLDISRNPSALASLPDDAFAKMPNLRVLDLSFNELTHLPESFYALTNLESVDLRYTHLDKATMERLVATFPRVKLDLRDVRTRYDIDDPSWKAVHKRVKEAAATARGDRPKAVAGFEAALALCKPGSCYSDYDELYALYGVVDALGHMRLAAEGAARAALTDKLVSYATRALERVPAPGTIWHVTDEGAFQEEVTRRTGNALAWALMERGALNQALAIVDRALSVGGPNGYVLDTKVRILLAMGREHDAYLIVDRVLTDDPTFGALQDLKAAEAFITWRAAHRQVAIRPAPLASHGPAHARS